MQSDPPDTTFAAAAPSEVTQSTHSALPSCAAADPSGTLAARRSHTYTQYETANVRADGSRPCDCCFPIP